MGKDEEMLKMKAIQAAIAKKVEEAKEQIKVNYENSLDDLKTSLILADSLLSPKSSNLQGYESYPLAVIELANILFSLKMRKRQQEMQAAQYLKQAMQKGCQGCKEQSCKHK